jgi:hypothetical protein
MIDIQVTVTCDFCGDSDVNWVGDSWEVDYFINNLNGWDVEDQDHVRCPKCVEPMSACSRCLEETNGDLDELGWTEFTDASMTGVVTLCNNCSAQHAALRIP